MSRVLCELALTYDATGDETSCVCYGVLRRCLRRFWGVWNGALRF